MRKDKADEDEGASEQANNAFHRKIEWRKWPAIPAGIPTTVKEESPVRSPVCNDLKLQPPARQNKKARRACTRAAVLGTVLVWPRAKGKKTRPVAHRWLAKDSR
jgi:hypothetical protein